MIQSIQNASGLKFQFTSNGNVHSIHHNDFLVNLYLGNEMEQTPSNIYLRIHQDNQLFLYPLLGPNSDSQFQIRESSYHFEGNVHQIHYRLDLELHPREPAWRYQVDLTNHNVGSLTCDLVYVQDLGICEYTAARLNEYFVCHYIHHEPIFSKDFGYGILSRQNESVSGKHPASFLFGSERVHSYATDGFDLYPEGIKKPLIGKRRQGEHAILGLEREPFLLSPNEKQTTSFYGYLFPNLESIDSFPGIQVLFQNLNWGKNLYSKEKLPYRKPVPSLFSSSKQIEGDSVSEFDLRTYFPNPWREVEKSEHGFLLSFFTDNTTHVVLKEKESRVLRPHGQILRTGKPDTLDESSLTTTCYFKGIFLSQLTEGHTSINQYLSRNHSYIGLYNSYGFRIFLEGDSGYELLGSPSFFVMQPNHVEWVYHWEKDFLRIQIEVTEDHKILVHLRTGSHHTKNFLLSFHTALDGDNGALEQPPTILINKTTIQVRPNTESAIYQRLDGKGFHITSENLPSWKIADDRNLFPDGQSRNQPYLTALVSVKSSLEFTIEGDLQASPSEFIPKNTEDFNYLFDLPKTNFKNKESQSFHQIIEILPWFEQNARIHYLNPRGLEQYSGGGWGTRDVCQGALEFLLARGKFVSCRSLLLRVFEEQNEDGDWPQWFMLYPRDKEIRAHDSHGDILYWPILALSFYLERTNDLNLLQEKTKAPHCTKPRTINDAINKTLSLIKERMISGTQLPIYGNGDWNDSLQPVKEEFRTKATSTWTAELQSLTYKALIKIYSLTDAYDKEKNLQSDLSKLKQNIKELCMEEGILTGLRYFGEVDSQKFYLHPKDKKTGIHYSVLPMIYGILSEVLDKEEVDVHLSIIKNFLTGVDGVRLFDAPVPYSDGVSQEFKRAETASYFGREIGLMYTHAHLRYCEALAHLGLSEEFFSHLNLVNPIGIQKKIPAANLRQSNCYYSSSDALFFDRKDANKNYKDLLMGKIPLEGGWRVYSSGPGIYIKLVYECLLGIQICHDSLGIDPSLPQGLDGLEWNVRLFDHDLCITYLVESKNATIESVSLNQKSIPLQRKENRYRRGGVKVYYTDLKKFLLDENNRLEIRLR